MNNDKLDVAVAVASNNNPVTELRTYKTIPLSFNREFFEILKIKYSNNEDSINKNEEQDFDRILFLGLLVWKKDEIGYEIIHVGKPAGKRVLRKLRMIATELLNIHTYPKINADAISVILNKALGIVDKRTMKDYRKTLLYYCNVSEELIDKCRDSRLGELDVSGFVRRIPALT